MMRDFVALLREGGRQSRSSAAAAAESHLAALPAEAAAGKLDEYHRAACSVFENAVNDALRARMGRE